MTLRADLTVARGTFTLEMAFEIAPGETAAVLGPNGSGKTTLLSALAGLVPLQRGRVELDGRLLEDVGGGVRVPPGERSVGVVFQQYLLFPHLTVLDNVAFGLRYHGRSRAAARRAAQAQLVAAGLDHLAGRLPAALSGGQAQRVALARALAIAPSLLLLDEPLAALDVRARAETRRALRAQLATFTGVKLLVTHDPLEAIALSSWLIVIEAGRVTQAGTAAEVTERPRSAWVADLVGVNLLRGRAHGDRVALESGVDLLVPDAGDGEVFVVIHPRAVALHIQRPEGTPRNVWQTSIVGLDHQGSRVRVRAAGPIPLVAEVTAGAVAALPVREGDAMWVSVKATDISVYPA
jgi:molybdate transport system ATP-binding protein